MEKTKFAISEKEFMKISLAPLKQAVKEINELHIFNHLTSETKNKILDIMGNLSKESFNVGLDIMNKEAIHSINELIKEK